MPSIKVTSPSVTYTDDYILSEYGYQSTKVSFDNDGDIQVLPQTTRYIFRTKRAVPRLGVMLVGWGGNNGTTVTGSVIANRLGIHWKTKTGQKSANYYGSITQASTVCLGTGDDGEVYVPMNALLPMVNPNDIVFDGWDISSMNLGDAMRRAEVFDSNLQDQLYPHMKQFTPRPSIYLQDFIAANQSERADNVLSGTKQSMLEQIRADIRDFQSRSDVDVVIVLWTANTERFSDVRPGLNDTAGAVLASIKRGESEVSPSTIFAVASILEGVTFINGSPQNTFVPGVIDLANKNHTFIGGDDLKSGQTKVKSVLSDFLVSAGIKLCSIVSYNHLGNNDGKNLSVEKTFRSKEISKSCVVADMVSSNKILYPDSRGPDHTVVIKYVPHVGDSKRAMDEYSSEIMMGGSNTIILHNTCEDSLLAAPLIIDLIVLAEICQRIQFKLASESTFQRFNSVLSILSYLCKAPLVPDGAPVVNALFRQRACIENVLRACLGLPPINHMMLEHKGATPRTSVSQNGGDVVRGVGAGVKRPTEADCLQDARAKKAATGRYINGDVNGDVNGDAVNGGFNGDVLNGGVNGGVVNGGLNGDVLNGGVDGLLNGVMDG